ncbi:MAG TPA: NAD(P)-dependent oxidoreductase [Acidiferrobacterales bacterium]|nr:NAD(P)-dependent oxidoreductase [Acidiferrobacterales bacterium]
MKVFIAGATGVLGRRLVRLLHERGHSVIGLQRRPANEPVIRGLGAESRPGDLFDVDALAHAAEGADVIVHAATAIPTGRRVTPPDFALNDRIRTEGTRALAAAKVGARGFLFQSIVWVATPPDGSPFDERSPVGHNPLYRSTIAGEAIAHEAGEKFGFAAGVLRCGWFYAPDSAHTRFMGKEIARRRLPIIGRGDAAWSLIHVDDAASAFAAVVAAPHRGLWHVVDDVPVPVAEFLRHFAERLAARPPFRVPTWLARLVAGNYAVGLLTTSIRTSNARFRKDFGWTPRYPSYREGLEQIVAAWRGEGFLPGKTGTH